MIWGFQGSVSITLLVLQILISILVSYISLLITDSWLYTLIINSPTKWWGIFIRDKHPNSFLLFPRLNWWCTCSVCIALTGVTVLMARYEYECKSRTVTMCVASASVFYLCKPFPAAKAVIWHHMDLLSCFKGWTALCSCTSNLIIPVSITCMVRM